MVCRKVREQNRLAPFSFSKLFFCFVIVAADTFDSTVDTMGRKAIAVAVTEDETGITVNLSFVKAAPHLVTTFFFQSVTDF